MALCPTGHRQSAVTAAGALGTAKPSTATATTGEKTPLLHWLVEHHPLCISPLPNAVLRISMPSGSQAAACQLLHAEA